MSTCLCVHGAIANGDGTFILCPQCDRVPDPDDGFEPIVCSSCRMYPPEQEQIMQRNGKTLRIAFCGHCAKCIGCEFCGDNRIDRVTKGLSNA